MCGVGPPHSDAWIGPLPRRPARGRGRRAAGTPGRRDAAERSLPDLAEAFLQALGATKPSREQCYLMASMTPEIPTKVARLVEGLVDGRPPSWLHSARSGSTR